MQRCLGQSLLPWAAVAVLLACVCIDITGALPTTDPSHPFHLSHADEVLFERFLAAFPRNYTLNSDEGRRRLAVFKDNLARYRKLNDEELPGHTAVYGVTLHADMTQDEFRRHLGTLPPSAATLESTLNETNCINSPVTCNNIATDGLPDSVDWREKGVLTPIKNQGECGGCWAFSAVETVEAMWLLAGNAPMEGDDKLSVQQVISCSTSDYGCRGGRINSAFKFILDASNSGKGLEQNSKFSFGCVKGCQNGAPSCPAVSSPFATINSTCQCRPWKQQPMMAYIAKYGPLAVKVDADSWNGYTGGVIRYHCTSDEAAGNHAVQIVGYGTEKTPVGSIDYWIVRNSWSSSWGEDGYVRIARQGNVCGIRNDVNFGFSPPPS